MKKFKEIRPCSLDRPANSSRATANFREMRCQPETINHNKRLNHVHREVRDQPLLDLHCDSECYTVPSESCVDIVSSESYIRNGKSTSQCKELGTVVSIPLPQSTPIKIEGIIPVKAEPSEPVTSTNPIGISFFQPGDDVQPGMFMCGAELKPEPRDTGTGVLSGTSSAAPDVSIKTEVECAIEDVVSDRDNVRPTSEHTTDKTNTQDLNITGDMQPLIPDILDIVFQVEKQVRSATSCKTLTETSLRPHTSKRVHAEESHVPVRVTRQRPCKRVVCKSSRKNKKSRQTNIKTRQTRTSARLQAISCTKADSKVTEKKLLKVDSKVNETMHLRGKNRTSGRTNEKDQTASKKDKALKKAQICSKEKKQMKPGIKEKKKSDEIKNIPVSESKFLSKKKTQRKTGITREKKHPAKSRKKRSVNAASKPNIEGLYKCTHCPFTSKHRAALHNHNYISHTDKTKWKLFKCPVPHCPRSFPINSRLTAHLKMHAGKKPQNEKMHRCSYCDYITNSKSQKQWHENTHTGVRPYACKLCDYRSTAPGALRRHVLVCVRKQAPPEDSNKVVDNKQSFDKIVGGQRKVHLCDFCGKGFDRKDQMRNHMLVHVDARPYKCSLCPSKYKQQIHLKSHVKAQHDKERTFLCHKCCKGFFEKSKMVRHLKTHMDKSDLAELHHCPHCDKSFKRKDGLQLHIRTHAGEKPYSCGACRKAFSDRSNLNHHLKKHPECNSSLKLVSGDD